MYIHKIYVTTLLPRRRRVKYIHFIRSQIHFSNKVVCVFLLYTCTRTYAAIKKDAADDDAMVCFCMPAQRGDREPHALISYHRGATKCLLSSSD